MQETHQDQDVQGKICMLTDSNSLGSNSCQSTKQRMHAYLVSTAKISYQISIYFILFDNELVIENSQKPR